MSQSVREVLQDPLVQRWAQRLPSETTREIYVYWLARFLEFADVEPEGTLKWSAEEAEDWMEEFKNYLLSRGKSGQTVALAWAALKRWFVDHRVRVVRRLRGVKKTRTYLDYIPTKRDLQKLLDAASLRHKVAISLIAFAGMRPVDAVNLRYANIKASYEKDEVPLTIVVQQHKTKEWYCCFLGPQGARYLRQWLELRERGGERVTDESYIVTGQSGEKISAVTLKNELRSLIDKVFGRHPTGEPFRRFRVYSLRKYFRRAAMKLDRDTAEFLMGHVSGIESLSAVYSGLRDLDPKALEQLKEEYVKILPELETELSEQAVKSELEELRERVRRMEEFVRMITGGLSFDELEELARAVLARKLERAAEEYGEALRTEYEELRLWAPHARAT